jgi:hypothetical protein
MARITSHFDISSSSVLRDRLRGGRLSHSKIVIGSGYLSRKGQRLRYRSKLTNPCQCRAAAEKPLVLT